MRPEKKNKRVESWSRVVVVAALPRGPLGSRWIGQSYNRGRVNS
jgi:hypothetical protein